MIDPCFDKWHEKVLLHSLVGRHLRAIHRLLCVSRGFTGGKSRQLYELFLGRFDYTTTDPRVTWGGEERCVRSEDATSRALGCTEVAVQCPEHGLDRCFLKSGPS